MISTDDRIKFIQSFAGYEKIDAYMDLSSLNKLKRAMVTAGLYGVEINEIKDSSIMNLLIKAQGKKPHRLMKHKAATKDARRKVIDL